jgi:hypothetical protein
MPIKVVPRSLTDAYKRREGDFSPNLVGLQFTDGYSLFTFGNFQITTTLDTRINKNYVLGGEWSDYISLENLKLDEKKSEKLSNFSLDIRLNFDIYKIDRYVYFGSFVEFIRVTLEQIIQKWKGSLYLNPTELSNVANNTVLSFNYNSGLNTSTFLIPKSVIKNAFQLVVDAEDGLMDVSDGEIYNLNRDYDKYVISNSNGNFKLIGYTGSTETYPYIGIKTKGNPFPSLTASTFGQLTYHVKPNDTEIELFFTQLDDFEKVLLNRLTSPIYTAYFSVPKESDNGVFFNDIFLTWPTSDGYNLDIDSFSYGRYVNDLISMATDFDNNKTNLIARRFVSESIHEYDTDGGGNETYGRKINKLLKIYGREFDEIKKYIDGISFANVVTYNKLDNTSDELIKMMAKTLGFDVLLTVGSEKFNILENIQPSYETPFSGYSRSLSAKELDIELWRRLIINAWWLFKSKGTRKVIEFFLNLFKIPECLISLNEYVYLAENKIDMDDFFIQLRKFGDIFGESQVSQSISDYPVDIYGFPKIQPNTPDDYFQNFGFWYNGGSESTQGNNPHISTSQFSDTYDFGWSYYDKYKCFIPNYTDLINGLETVTVNTNYFTNYNNGTFISDSNNPLPAPYYSVGYADTLNKSLVENVVVKSAGLVQMGRPDSPKYGVPNGDTFSMKIKFIPGSEKTSCDTCNYNVYFSETGLVAIKPTTYTKSLYE